MEELTENGSFGIIPRNDDVLSHVKLLVPALAEAEPMATKHGTILCARIDPAILIQFLLPDQTAVVICGLSGRMVDGDALASVTIGRQGHLDSTVERELAPNQRTRGPRDHDVGSEFGDVHLSRPSCRRDVTS